MSDSKLTDPQSSENTKQDKGVLKTKLRHSQTTGNQRKRKRKILTKARGKNTLLRGTKLSFTSKCSETM